MAEEEFDSSEFSFLYFAITILSLILLTLTQKLVKPLLNTFIIGSYRKDPRYKKLSSHSSSQRKIDLDIKSRRYQWFGAGYIVKAFIWLIILLVFINAWQQLPDPELMRGFDPFEILEVSRRASPNEIKKAFRSLSLKYHPDKVEDPSPQSEAKYLRIMKAYDCLQNPKTMKNCQLYGNPNGFSGYQIGIALPNFMIYSGYSLVNLIIFVFLFIVAVYGAVFLVSTKNIGKYDKYGLLRNNLYIYREAFRRRSCTSIFGCIDTVSKLEEIQRLKPPKQAQLSTTLLKHGVNLPEDHPALILWAFIFGVEIDPSLQQSQQELIKLVLLALQSMAEYAMKYTTELRVSWRPGMLKPPFSIHDLTHYCMQSLRTQALIVQGLGDKALPEQQLSNSNGIRGEFQKALEGSIDNLDQLVTDELKHFPLVRYEVNVEKFDPFVGISELTTSDLFLVKFTIKNLRPTTFVHSLKYPFIREHYWHVVLLFEGTIIQYERISEGIEGQFKIVPYLYSFNPNLTRYQFNLQIFSDSYLGYDYSKVVEIEAKQSLFGHDHGHDHEQEDDSDSDKGNKEEQQEQSKIRQKRSQE